MTQDDARRVLMISYAFAPGSGVAAQRTMGFARHLPDCGWDPTVLTARAPNGEELDDDLGRRTGGRAAVIRTRHVGRRAAPSGRAAATLSTGRGRGSAGADAFRRVLRTWLLVPDEAIGWLPFAAATGSAFVERSAPAAVYSTSGPPTAHLVALLLSTRWRLPWVADFRDPWTAVPNRARRDIYSSRSRLAIDRALERAVLGRADAVVTVSEEQQRIMLRLAPERVSGRYHVITNGYEPEWVRRGPGNAAAMTVCYTGSFYRAGEEPGPVFRALAGLCDSRALAPGDLRLLIASPQHERVAESASGFGLAHSVSTLPPVPHAESRALQRESAVLWLALSAAHGAQGALTAKIYEYMAARRPVLAVVPPDSPAGDLIRRTGIGVAVDPRDIAGLQRELLRLVEEHKATGGVAWWGSRAAIAPFARPRLAAELASVLDEVTAGHGAAGGSA